MREARGPHWTDWLHEHGVVALTGVDTRSLVLHLREQRRDARGGRRASDVDVDEVLAAVRAQPQMAGAALVAGVSTHERYTFAADGRGARRGRRLRLQALDPAPARGERRCGRRLPARRRRRHARGLRRRAARRRAPAIPRRSPTRRQTSARAARPHARARRLPRPPAARARDRQGDVQAAVRPPRREPSGARPPHAAACSSRRRTTASRSPPATRRGVTHSSLYDGTVEGLDYPELRARSAQFHPEAAPGPARRGVDHRRLGRGAEGRCLGAPTSSRSA